MQQRLDIALTNPNAGTQAHRDYYMAKGYTVNIKQLSSGHWGIIWSKNYTNITTIEEIQVIEGIKAECKE